MDQQSEPVAQLLQDIQSGSVYKKIAAATAFGKMKESNEEMVVALLLARADADDAVKRAAASALEAASHQQYLQDHPEVIQKVKESLRPEIDKLQSEVDELTNHVWMLGGIAIVALFGAFLVFTNLSTMFYAGGIKVVAGFIIVIAAVVVLKVKEKAGPQQVNLLLAGKTRELKGKKEYLEKLPDSTKS